MNRKSSAPPSWRRYTRFWGRDIAADVDDELHFHIEMRVAEYIALGMTPDEAMRRAERRFGSFDRAKIACVGIHQTHARTESRTQMIANTLQDAGFALRVLRRQRLPALVAVLCLALGIGATTTMFSVANTLLLRPLPFPNGSRLVGLYSVRGGAGASNTVSSYPDFMDWRARQHSFTDLAAVGSASYTIVRATPMRVNGSTVSPSFFKVLGVQPELGRAFRDDEDAPGADPVMVISHGMADRLFGGAANAVGAQVNASGKMRTIVGVVPDVMRYPTYTDVWTPMPRDRSTNRSNRNLDVIGELRPGVPFESARADMAAIGASMSGEFSADDAEIHVAIEPLRERFVGSARAGLFAMSCATILVLLVSCTNVAGLQLARAGMRAREIAVRSALGAARGRLVRQLLTESMLLSVVGGLCGTGLAIAGAKTVARAIAGSVPAWMTFELDMRALVFTLVVSMLVGVAFGVAPALRLARMHPSDVLRGGRRAVGSSGGRLQSAFVVAQIALSVVLVIGATLAIESVVRLANVPLGIDPRGVFTFRISMQGSRYDSSAARARVVADLERRVAAIPSVDVAGATTYAPIAGCCSQFGTIIDGQPVAPGHELLVTGNIITPGFFRALRIPLLQGREFTDADGAHAPAVLIVNETFAKRFWPAGDALGHRADTGGGMGTIVGVVGDIKQGGLVDPPEPQFYRPYAQDSWNAMTFTIRVAGDAPSRILPDVRRAVHDIDPALAVYATSTLEKIIGDAISPKQLFGELFVSLALVALVLAAAGVYAVMSFYVSQRTQEIGLRMALGAESHRVLALVLRRGVGLAVTGGVIGLAGGAVAARILAHQLYAVDAREPAVYVVATVVLVLIASFASFGPARRASSVDPMVALRAE